MLRTPCRREGGRHERRVPCMHWKGAAGRQAVRSGKETVTPSGAVGSAGLRLARLLMAGDCQCDLLAPAAWHSVHRSFGLAVLLTFQLPAALL